MLKRIKGCLDKVQEKHKIPNHLENNTLWVKKNQLARKTGKTLFLSRLNKTEVHQLALIFIQQNKKENSLQMQKKELELNFENKDILLILNKFPS